jgi:hypothetical protein
MLSRREFIGAACSVALASRATALPSDQFRWAMSSHMFTPLKPHPEAGIKVAARFGFHGIEPWGNELELYLKQPPEVFKKVLDEAGIGISSVASGGEYFDSSKLIQILRDRHYDGWISLDFNYVDMLPGVTIEQDMAAHRKYLVETLHASLTPMK